MAVVTADDEENKLFAFTCTSDYVAIVDELDVPKSRLGTCIDSGASRDYCPNCAKFSNYKEIKQKITTADGQTLSAAGMGDLHIELPNGHEKTKIIFKNAIHAPNMAFMLISISRLNKAGYSVTFNKEMCTIQDPKCKTIATIPHSNGLYKITAQRPLKEGQTTNVVSEKMSISKAHRKLGHVAHSAIKHATADGLIMGINLYMTSKLDFCEACTKVKSARQPFPKESETRAERFGKRVHWDLWGPASVKSLNGNQYVAAQINDATRQMKLYFQAKKSQTFDSCKKDQAYIENQTGH